MGPTAFLPAISGTFHSLFKVLFIFPSRYLFAIGLLLIFSFRWNLPPTLRCTLKQRDSAEGRGKGLSGYGAATLSGVPFKATFPERPVTRSSSRLQFAVYSDLKVELFPLHSPLLGESLLVSFPPLSYMLKFSGSSYLISGQKE